MENTCKNCKHFQNQKFDNKAYGYCEKLWFETYVEDKKGKILNDAAVVTNKDFGCVRFEKQE